MIHVITCACILLYQQKFQNVWFLPTTFRLDALAFIRVNFLLVKENMSNILNARTLWDYLQIHVCTQTCQSRVFLLCERDRDSFKVMEICYKSCCFYLTVFSTSISRFINIKGKYMYIVHTNMQIFIPKACMLNYSK